MIDKNVTTFYSHFSTIVRVMHYQLFLFIFYLKLFF